MSDKLLIVSDIFAKFALGFAIVASVIEGMEGNWSACVWAGIAALWIFSYIIKN